MKKHYSDMVWKIAVTEAEFLNNTSEASRALLLESRVEKAKKKWVADFDVVVSDLKEAILAVQAKVVADPNISISMVDADIAWITADATMKMRLILQL